MFASNAKSSNSLNSFTLGQSKDEGKTNKQLKREEKLRNRLKKFKDNVLRGIDEIMVDIENIHDEIASQALDHFNPKDIILTYGQSDIQTSFLKYAYYGGESTTRLPGAKDFEVLVCETAPVFSGHVTA